MNRRRLSKIVPEGRERKGVKKCPKFLTSGWLLLLLLLLLTKSKRATEAVPMLQHHVMKR
jgi:hypothetical protein